MKSRPKNRKSASNKSSIVKGFFKPANNFPTHVTIGGLRPSTKVAQILKKIK